ncbi:MAG: C-terminal binding protein [Solirubrobacterales bacterium]
MKVLVTDYVFEHLDVERSVLEPLGAELVEAPGTSEAELVEAVAGADAMLVCYAKVTRPVVEAAAEAGVKVMSRYGIGFDNIDIDAATEREILVTYVPDYCLDDVADHAMTLLLSLARGAHHAALGVREGEWVVHHGEVHRLQGRRLALIGTGGIGRRMIDRAHGFGIEVVGFDPYLDPWDIDAERAETFEEAIADADYISLHVPLTDETKHIIDSESMAVMNRAPIVINTARGPLVAMEDLVPALDSGQLGGVGLDVTEVEPPPADHPLRTHPRAILTPHMGFYSVEAVEELQRRAAEEVARALQGHPPDRPVNPDVVKS